LNSTIDLSGGGTLAGTGVATVNVGTDGSIGQGIDIASTSATVNIASGAYAEAVTIDKTLTLAAAGTATADSWTLDAGHALTLQGGFATADDGSFAFNGAVTLGADTTLTAGAGAVAFGSTLDGGSDLTVNSSGATSFAGVVGG